MPLRMIIFGHDEHVSAPARHLFCMIIFGPP